MGNKRINLNESQIARLQELASDTVDQDLARRAKAILGRNEGKSILTLAKELGVNKDFIGRWETRYLENGIDALYTRHGGGRVSPVEVPDLDQRITDAIEARKGTHWSKQELADELGIKLAKLDHELAKLNLTPMRKTSWSFTTKQTIHARNISGFLSVG